VSPGWVSSLDWLAALGAGVLALVLLLLFRRWWRRARRSRAYSNAAAGVDLARNDPRWDAELETDEDLRAARLSVRVEPRITEPALLEYAASPAAGAAGSDLTPSPDPTTAAVLLPLILSARANPTDPLALQNLGLGLAARGLLRTAASAFRQALRELEDPVSYFYLAVCFRLLDRSSWARQALKLSVRSDKTFAPSHAFLGFLALEDGDTSGAAVALARSMALDPERPEPHLGLAWLHLQRGEHEEAEWEFEEAFRSAPEFEDAVDAVREGANPVDVVRWDGVFAIGGEDEERPGAPPEAAQQ